MDLLVIDLQVADLERGLSVGRFSDDRNDN